MGESSLSFKLDWTLCINALWCTSSVCVTNVFMFKMTDTIVSNAHINNNIIILLERAKRNTRQHLFMQRRSRLLSDAPEFICPGTIVWLVRRLAVNEVDDLFGCSATPKLIAVWAGLPYLDVLCSRLLLPICTAVDAGEEFPSSECLLCLLSRCGKMESCELPEKNVRWFSL